MQLPIIQGADARLDGVDKFGQNSDIDTSSVPEDIWSGGGIYTPPTQARIHELVSDSVDDAAAGTGARTVTVYGLGANWESISETVTLNGTTVVATTNAYLRVFRAMVGSTGSAGVNAGVITATATTDATVSAEIPVAVGQTLMAHYSTPNKDSAVICVFASLGRSTPTGAVADLALMIRPDAANPEAPTLTKMRTGIALNGQNPLFRQFTVPVFVPPKSDVWIRCEDVSDNNTTINAGFELVYDY